MKAKIAVLASGDGSNFEALAKASRSSDYPAEITGLLVNRTGIEALRRAERLGVPTAILKPKDFASRTEWDRAMVNQLNAWRADWVVLAGFLSLIGPEVLRAFPNRMVNSHPSLLPNFGGPGMYGHRVHQAVIAAKATETGITFHLIDEVYDHGTVLMQEKIPVLASDTPETLAARLKARENELYPRILADLVRGKRPSG